MPRQQAPLTYTKSFPPKQISDNGLTPSSNTKSLWLSQRTEPFAETQNAGLFARRRFVRIISEALNKCEQTPWKTSVNQSFSRPKPKRIDEINYKTIIVQVGLIQKLTIVHLSRNLQNKRCNPAENTGNPSLSSSGKLHCGWLAVRLKPILKID